MGKDNQREYDEALKLVFKCRETNMTGGETWIKDGGNLKVEVIVARLAHMFIDGNVEGAEEIGWGE